MQVEFSRYRPKITPNVKTILHDYSATVIPNKELKNFVGHKGNVKCVEFVGEKGDYMISGSRYDWSSDNQVIIRVESGIQIVLNASRF